MAEARRETKKMREQVEENIRAPLEEAARLSRDQIEAGERTAQTGVDMVQTSLDTFQRNMALTMGLFEDMTQRSAQLFGSNGGNEAQQAAQQSSRNLQTASAVTDTFGDMSSQWIGFAQKRAQRNVDHWTLLIGCRTPQEFADAQSTIFRDNLGDFLQIWRQSAECSMRVGETTARGARNAARAVNAERD